MVTFNRKAREKARARLAEKYGPNWQLVLAEKMRQALAAKLSAMSEEERRAYYSARQRRAAATIRAKYGVEWLRESARRNFANSPHFTALEKLYGPKWRSITGRKAAMTRLRRGFKMPRPKGRTFFQAGNVIWRKSPRAYAKFTKEERYLGRLHSLVRRCCAKAIGVYVSPLLVEITLFAVPRKEPCVFGEILQAVRDDFGTVSDRQVSRALRFLEHYKYVEHINQDDARGLWRRIK